MPAPFIFVVANFTARHYSNHTFPKHQNQKSIPQTENYAPKQTMNNYLQTMYKNTQTSYLSPIKVKTTTKY